MISGQHAFQMVWIFCLALAIATCLGVGGWGILSSHSYLLCISRLESAHNCCFLFYEVHFQHLSLSEKSWGLCSVLRTLPWFLLSDIFPEEVPKLSEIFCTIWSRSTPLLRCQVDDGWPLVWQRSGGILVPCSPFMIGVPKLLGRTACDCKKCPRKSSPCLLFLPFHCGEGLNGILPFSLTGLIFVSVIHHVLWGG